MFYRENGQFKTSYAADQQIFGIAQDRWAILALIAFAFVGVPLLADEYLFRAIFIPFLILALAAVGVNILVGYCGQISLGSGAFMAVGAYAAYNTFVRIEGMPLLVALLSGGFFATLVGMFFGALITIAVQSSSITTSILVPLMGSGVLAVRNAYPIMLGANLGTTITALLASLAVDLQAGLVVALTHTLFNVAAIVTIYPVRRVRYVPVQLAERLAGLAIDNRAYVILYVAGFFVAVPLLGIAIFG